MKRAEAEAVRGRLLEIRAEHGGTVPLADIEAAAQTLGCHVRTVYRLLHRVPSQRSSKWTPDPTVLQPLLEITGGCLSRTHELLIEKGMPAPVGRRQFQRRIAGSYDVAALDSARRGHLPVTHRTPTLDLGVWPRNGCWAMDHTWYPLWVRVAKGQARRVIGTHIVDMSPSRLLMAAGFTTEDPSTEYSVSVLAEACKVHWVDGKPVGGRPNRLLTDRGPDFVNRAQSFGLASTAIQQVLTDGYSPHQNGRCEACNYVLKRRHVRLLPGYFDVDRLGHKERKALEAASAQCPVDPADCPWFKDAVHLLQESFQEYNFRERPRALKGLTRFESWSADPTPLDEVPDGAIAAACTLSVRRKVTNGAVQLDNRRYLLGDPKDATGRRINVEGQTVEVRHLPTRIETVYVYRENGQKVGPANWDRLRTDADVQAAMARRQNTMAVVRFGRDQAPSERVQHAKRLMARGGASDHDLDLRVPAPPDIDPETGEIRSAAHGSTTGPASAVPRDQTVSVRERAEDEALPPLPAITAKTEAARRVREDEARLFKGLNERLSAAPLATPVRSLR